MATITNPRRDRDSRSISVDGQEKVCINCIQYEHYFRKSHVDEYWFPTTTGYCLAMNKLRGPLMKCSCKHYKPKDNKRG